MSMVFYGHFIERVMLLNDPTAAVLYKFILFFYDCIHIVGKPKISGPWLKNFIGGGQPHSGPLLDGRS